MTNTAPDLSLTKTHVGHFSQGQTDATYTLTVYNTGTAPTFAPVQVTDMPPSGMTVTAISGTGWSCNAALKQCSRNDVLVNGPMSSYPPVTVTVSVGAAAAASLINSASVSGGGEANLSNDFAADPTSINAIQDVTAVVKVTQTGFVFNRGTGLWTATMTIQNTGAQTMTGPLQIVLTQLTSGVTMANKTGMRNGSPVHYRAAFGPNRRS